MEILSVGEFYVTIKVKSQIIRFIHFTTNVGDLDTLNIIDKLHKKMSTYD
jgi:hypothetical protein